MSSHKSYYSGGKRSGFRYCSFLEGRTEGKGGFPHNFRGNAPAKNMKKKRGKRVTIYEISGKLAEMLLNFLVEICFQLPPPLIPILNTPLYIQNLFPSGKVPSKIISTPPPPNPPSRYATSYYYFFQL